MRISAKTNHYLLSILFLGLMTVYSPGPLTSKEKTSQGKASLAQAGEKEKEYPKLEGKEECFNYRISGKKINCACSHKCDFEKGDPNNRYIVPGQEDWKCSNHCKKDKCKCKTKCQT